MSGPRVMRPKSIATVVPVFVVTGAGEVDAEALDGDVGLGRERLDLGDGADQRRLADGVAAGDHDLHRHRQAGGRRWPRRTRHRARHRRVELRLHGSPPAAVRAAARRGARRRPRSGAPAPSGRRTRSPTSTRTTPTGVRRRAESSATDVGVWHSSMMRRSSGVALRPQLLGRDQREDGRVQREDAERRARPAPREHVRTHQRPRAGTAAPGSRGSTRPFIGSPTSAARSAARRSSPGVSALAHFSTSTAIS